MGSNYSGELVKRFMALGIAVVMVAGCASAHVKPVASLACPEGGFGFEVIAIANSFYPPVPQRFFLPPLPPPADVRGHRMIARLVVDTTGSLVRDSITVCGIPNPAYQLKLAQELAKLAFEPARRDGEAVRSPVFISYSF